MRVNMVNVVKGFLTAKPELRDSDVDLIWSIWAWQLSQAKPAVKIEKLSARDLMSHWKKKNVSSPFNISRSRRKCQEHYNETRGENHDAKQEHQGIVKQDVKRATNEANRVLSKRSANKRR